MENELENFYLKQAEPNQSCFLALRTIIKKYDEEHITEHLKYGLPFFYYKGKMFCYLWKDKKTTQPYISLVKGNLLEHPQLIQGERKRMKAFYIEPEADIPIELLYSFFDELVKTY